MKKVFIAAALAAMIVSCGSKGSMRVSTDKTFPIFAIKL